MPVFDLYKENAGHGHVAHLRVGNERERDLKIKDGWSLTMPDALASARQQAEKHQRKAKGDKTSAE